MKKLFILFALILFPLPVLAGYFPDVPDNHPYAEAINELKRVGVIDGYADGKYRPDDKINRAEFSKIVMKSKYPYIQTNTGIAEDCQLPFSDISLTDWHYNFLCLGFESGIFNGYPDGTFKSGNNINVVEGLKITFTTYQKVSSFNDAVPWFKLYVDYANGNNLWIPSWTKNDQLITRGEMAELVYRLIKEQGGVYPNCDIQGQGTWNMGWDRNEEYIGTFYSKKKSSCISIFMGYSQEDQLDYLSFYNADLENWITKNTDKDTGAWINENGIFLLLYSDTTAVKSTVQFMFDFVEDQYPLEIPLLCGNNVMAAKMFADYEKVLYFGMGYSPSHNTCYAIFLKKYTDDSGVITFFDTIKGEYNEALTIDATEVFKDNNLLKNHAGIIKTILSDGKIELYQ